MKGHSTLSALPFSDQTDNPLDPQGWAEKLGEYFAEKFLHTINLKEVDQETLQEALLNNDEEDINKEFKIHEIELAIKGLKTKSSIGSDLIHNQFILNFPMNQRVTFLKILNNFFHQSIIAQDWKKLI